MVKNLPANAGNLMEKKTLMNFLVNPILSHLVLIITL